LIETSFNFKSYYIEDSSGICFCLYLLISFAVATKKIADNPPFVPHRESTEETVLYILPASIQGIIFALLIIAIYHD
jgi:hypothetical protein